MRIWIDGKEVNALNRVGSGQYAFEIVRNLERIDAKNEYTILLPSEPVADLPKERRGWKYRVLKPAKAWTRIAIPAILLFGRNKPDIFFTPSHYIPRFSRVKRVCTIFDLSYLHFPEMFNKKDLWQLKNWSKYSIENANHIFVISDFTKNDLVENYKINSKKITVTHLGYDTDMFRVKSREVEEIKNKYKIFGDYIIYVGTIQPRKNLVRLIEAFSKIKQASKLVIVGKTNEAGRKGWLYQDILDLPKKLGIDDQVIFTGFVPTKDLSPLLTGSKAFVLPSLWEGFGIPVLEAMASGTAVIVSNISSLPEVAGEAGIYIDPNSIDSIKEAIEKLLKDDKLREKKVQLGLRQVQKFSWEEAAKKTLEVLENV
jgi:glycosyltransferase involved in cell wall biosynthesis